MYNIDVYNTHIEISPYQLGDVPKLEKMCSVYIRAEYRYNPLGFYYDEEKRILYTHRGVSLPWLEEHLSSKIIMHHNYDKYDRINNLSLVDVARNMTQNNAIDFLSSSGRFTGKENSQLILNLDTGDGKTYCTIAAITKLKKKAIIITHTDTIRNQWVNSFLKHTDIKEDKMKVIEGLSAIEDIISGKDNDADIYFVSHATISFCANRKGWDYVRLLFEKLCVGIKVYDEAHLCFKNVIRTDMFSNTFITIYLTATLGRSDESENRLYKRCFENAYKFGIGSADYIAHNKHIIYVPMMYNSGITQMEISRTNTNYGFSFNRYLDILMNNGSCELEYMIYYALWVSMKVKGRILITTSTVASINWIYNLVKKIKNMDLTVGTYHSKNDNSTNMETKENADIIISTIKGNGTGSDIKGLRCIINIESYSSGIISKQLAGRLRPFPDERECYIFDIIDNVHPSTIQQYKSRLKQMQSKCKEVRVMNIQYPYCPFDI